MKVEVCMLRGYERVSVSYYENGNLRKKQKAVGKNRYSIERYDENEETTQKGVFFRDENVFYWVGELLTFNRNKSLKIVTNYSEDGELIINSEETRDEQLYQNK